MTMTKLEIAAKQIADAQQEVKNLVSWKAWRTSVPPRVTDSDAVILRGLAAGERLLNERTGQWHVFDKDDDSTWPEEPVEGIPAFYYVVNRGGISVSPYVVIREWSGHAPHWTYFTHWMPIEVPEPQR
jgi:hypothetical protein